MENKKPWFSKTIVVNAILGVLAAITVFVPAADMLKQFILNHAGEIGMGWSVLGIVLRLISKDKISLED